MPPWNNEYLILIAYVAAVTVSTAAAAACGTMANVLLILYIS